MPADRQKQCAWSVGALTDELLGSSAGIAPRAVGMMLNAPGVARHVSGRGLGGKRFRRVHGPARTALAIIGGMNGAGVTLELSANILGAAPVLASAVAEVVDYTPPGTGFCSLLAVDPSGGWLPTDIVPAPVWTRFVYPCRDVQNENPKPGDIHRVPIEAWAPNTAQGTMKIDRSALRLPDVELVRIDELAVYEGEIDPAGLYADDWSRSVAMPAYDDHLLIVNGRWVIHKQPDPTPLDALYELYTGEPVFKDREQQQFHFSPVAEIDDGRRAARTLRPGDDDAQAAALDALRNAESVLDINMTLAARRMKRRAYGLPVTAG